MVSNAAIILARTDSRRFPNKALYRINGKPLITYCFTSLIEMQGVTPILATSSRAIDDPLISIAEEYNIKYFRGSAENIAQRLNDCINFFNIKHFARINGDSPFLRKELISKGFEVIEKEDLDLVTNLMPRSFPYGVSIEIIKASIFLHCFNEINKDKYKEHVTSYFYDHISKFKYKNFQLEKDLSYMRLTVDEPDDIPITEFIFSRIPDINFRDFQSLVDVYNDYR